MPPVWQQGWKKWITLVSKLVSPAKMMNLARKHLWRTTRKSLARGWQPPRLCFPHQWRRPSPDYPGWSAMKLTRSLLSPPSSPLPTYLLPEFYILWPRLIGLAGPPRELRSRLFRCIDSSGSSRRLVRSTPFPFRIRKKESVAVSAI